MFELANTQYTYLFILPIVVWISYLLYTNWRTKKQDEIADASLYHSINPNRSNRKLVIKQLLQLLGMASLVIALINPKVGTRLETITRKGVDVVFAIDVVTIDILAFQLRH